MKTVPWAVEAVALGLLVGLSLASNLAAQPAGPKVAAPPILGESLSAPQRDMLRKTRTRRVGDSGKIDAESISGLASAIRLKPADVKGILGAVKTSQFPGLEFVHKVEIKAGDFLPPDRRLRAATLVEANRKRQRENLDRHAGLVCAAAPALTKDEAALLLEGGAALPDEVPAGSAAATGSRTALWQGVVGSFNPSSSRLTIQPFGRNKQPVTVVLGPTTRLRVLGRSDAAKDIKPGMTVTARCLEPSGQALFVDIKAALRKPKDEKPPSPGAPVQPGRSKAQVPR